MSRNEAFDVIIVGGGPSGSSCALSLSRAGLNVLLVDKAKFPRDKICGDALSLDVINQLPKISPHLVNDFDLLSGKMPAFGVRLFSPDLTCIDLPFVYKGQQRCGYIVQRLEFDDLLFQEVKRSGNIRVVENCEVTAVNAGTDRVTVMTNASAHEASIIVGADGANSVVRQLQGRVSVDRDHHSAGLRVYYEGLNSFHTENFIELYFFKDILPGYLWLFPMAGNRANVGIGMLSSLISKKRINLREVLHRLISTHPALTDRFATARPLENMKGHGLPLGSKRRSISGERFLLTGDAAGLIDPFTGEGIGNAIRSGRVAAEHIQRCFKQMNFSSSFNKSYDQEINRRMGKEFNISHRLQQLCRYPALFNFIFKKAKANPYWHDFLTKALADVDQKKQFKNPMFYYRLLFG
ncbi:MAG TPA: geranylgeranyl reductase family protein [Cyclobacteriaceae bacterium]|nr:geranylgeranyl reductase family protein [Cyclobacteriaceae bacterium]